MSNSQETSSRALSNARLWILFLVALLVAVVCLWISSSIDNFPSDILKAVGTGFIVSALFGITQLVLTTGSTRDTLLTLAADEVRKIVLTLRKEHELANTRYFPTDQFPASATPLPEYNRTFMRDLSQTSELFFRGMSARHTAARLLVESISNIDLTLIIPDLTQPDSLSERVNYIRRFEQRDIEFGEACEKVRNEILVGIVGTYKVRYSCHQIHLVLTSSPTLDRVEIMHNSLWVTPFTDVRQPTEKYAESLRFDNDSLLHKIQCAEANRIRNSPKYRSYHLQPETSLTRFFEIYTEMTGQPIDQEKFEALTREFDSFTAEFFGTAMLGLK